MLQYIFTASAMVTLCVTLSHVMGSENELVLRKHCGNSLMFECTIVGGPFDITVWRGSAFNCLMDEIILLHSRFTIPEKSAYGMCNNGSIVGKSLEAENGSYTSQLNVIVTSDIVGKSIECFHDFSDNKTIVGSLNITMPGCYPSPIQSKVNVKEISLEKKYIFTWSLVVLDCPSLHYKTLSSNCGSCPTTTTNTTVTCTNVPIDGSMCTFAVQTVVCGDILLEEILSVNMTHNTMNNMKADTNYVVYAAPFVIIILLLIVAIAVVWFFIRKYINSQNSQTSNQIDALSSVHENDNNHQTIRIFDNKTMGIYSLESTSTHSEENHKATEGLGKVHLDLNSLLHILKGEAATVTVTSQWYALGLSIGVPQEFLEKLKEYPENDCLVEVLDFWLRHHPGQPTWKEIIDAQKAVATIQHVHR